MVIVTSMCCNNREFETCHGTKLKTSYTKLEKEVQCCMMLLWEEWNSSCFYDARKNESKN